MAKDDLHGPTTHIRLQPQLRRVRAFAVIASLCLTSTFGLAAGPKSGVVVARSGLAIPALPGDMVPIFDGESRYLVNGEDVACGWSRMTDKGLARRLFQAPTEQKAQIEQLAKRLSGVSGAVLTSVKVAPGSDPASITADLVADAQVKTETYSRELVLSIKQIGTGDQVAAGFCIYPAAKREQRRAALAKLAGGATPVIRKGAGQ